MYLIPEQLNNIIASSKQNTTYEDHRLGLKIDYHNTWKPIDKTFDTTHENITEFAPIIQSEHQPPTPFFNIDRERK
jgi:hypothetical protein